MKRLFDNEIFIAELKLEELRRKRRDAAHGDKVWPATLPYDELRHLDSEIEFTQYQLYLYKTQNIGI